jgi:outer membrane protein assembly factor BamB
MGSAFSSPYLTQLDGRDQLLVQTRSTLAAVNPEDGSIIWSHVVPSFRGMNILTPTVFDDGIFTSTYQGKSFFFRPKVADGQNTLETAWTNGIHGYMSTPVIIDGHAYLHLQNQRFACLDLRTGKERWISPKPFGKYWSMAAQGDRILALDQKGELLLVRANPEKFELLDSRKISEAETWGHLAVAGNQLYIRELHAIAAYQWR